MKKTTSQNSSSTYRIIHQTSWFAEWLYRGLKHSTTFIFQLFRLSNHDMNPL